MERLPKTGKRCAGRLNPRWVERLICSGTRPSYLLLIIPWRSIDPVTLDRLLEEIVTRDGTDYGSAEKTTAQKITAARNQLSGGYAVLFWNAELESASLVSKEEAGRLAERGSEQEGEDI